jgi:hypothetical protein
VVVRVRDHAYTTVTTQGGQYWLAGLPAGTYTLIAEHANATAEREVTVPGPAYDLVIDGDADVAKETRREGKTARPAKAGGKRAER